MGTSGAVGRGFVAASSIICLFLTVVWLPSYTGLLPALVLLAVLAAPFAVNSLRTVDKLNQHTSDVQASVKKAKAVLMALQGLGFACWFYDVLSTIYQINILQAAFELNFLGWPFSALGALLFYVPMVFVAYFLLYRVKTKFSFYVAVLVSVLVLFMGALNFNAALYNFWQVYPLGGVADFVVVGVWVAVLLVFSGLNLASAKRFLRA
jgi:Glucose dehydrogenase